MIVRVEALRLIGYWAGPHESGWPRVKDFVDPGWDARERERIAIYLREGMSIRFYMGISMCRLCGSPNGSGEQTDGTYLWPEGLTHYVEVHNVRLPEEFVEHALRVQDAFDGVEVDRDWWRGRA
jgi:hypothetical protein